MTLLEPIETATVPRIFTSGLNFFLSIFSDLFILQATRFEVHPG